MSLSVKSSKDAAAAVKGKEASRAARTTKNFEEEFAKLNPAQRQAVETIEGPVMVIAGPGTGKTQVVSMRVANILRKTQMRPSNILCLTFSVSGATAMRDRLRQLIGPDAYGVTVRTIHGFCQDVIEEHPMLFDEWSARQQISDIERYREVNTIIDQLLPDLAIVNPKNPYTRTKEMLGRISQCKREGKVTKDVREAVGEYEIQMEGKSKPGTKAHEKNLLAARKFAEFAEIFARYQAMLQKTQRYDYDDMILYVIRALSQEDWLLAGLQERFQYILVDEFQDTNGAQYKVIDLLTTYATLPQDPNLFVVGDDDQAIYRFQGANLSNILSFRQRFPRAAVIPLTISYRSTQSILDAAGKVIAHNTERLVGRIEGLQKDLKAASGEEGEPPVLLRPPNDMAEPWLVSDLIDERLRTVPAKEIAVLTQTNSELRGFYDVLRSRGIPVQMTGKVDLLTHPKVMQANAILRAVHKPNDNGLLAAALSAECLACHPADLASIFAHCREQKCSVMDVLRTLDAAVDSNLFIRNRDALIHARDLILDLHQKLPTRTVIETVEKVIHEGGLLSKEGMDPLDLAALQEFFNRVKGRLEEQPSFTFEQWMADIAFYENPEYGELRMSYELPHLESDGVQLMTAHQSKGKEFETVILVNFRDGHWDKRRNPASLAIPEDILFGWQKEQKSFEQHQDERRVAYVSMTRAKRELIFTCPHELTSGSKAREVAPSAFFAEAGNLPELEGNLKDPTQASTLLHPPIRHIDDELRSFLRKRLETFALSVSGINRFLEDPREFLEVDLLQVPQLSGYALAYGNAVHWALRQWALQMQRGMPIGKEQFLGEFRNFLLQREYVADGEMRNLLHLGEEALPRYFDARLDGATPVIYNVEGAFTAHLEDPSGPDGVSVPLKGRIDRIDQEHPDSPRVTVIDFKTGRPQAEAEIRNGDYFRQLQFYAVLLELSRPILEPKEFVLDFVGEREEHPIVRSFQIGDQDKTDMKKLIRDIWAKVTALDFTPL